MFSALQYSKYKIGPEQIWMWYYTVKYRCYKALENYNKVKEVI